MAPTFDLERSAMARGASCVAGVDEVGIEYFTSPYDFESVDYVDPYVNVYKIGSGDITWIEIVTGMVEADFPEHLSTHNRTQRFHFDPKTGLLRQHDYTAEVIGSLAKAAHVILDHSEMNGLKYASRRRVTPRSSRGNAFRGPTLIEITIHNYRLQ